MRYLPIILALVGGLPEPWFADPILPPDVARDEVRRWVVARLVPPPPAEGRAGDDRAVHLWEARRAAVREELLDVTGLRGAWPPTWPLNVRMKQTLRREGYTIEKLTYGSSAHSHGVNCLVGDGAVRLVKSSIGLKVWQAFSTRFGGELISAGDL